MDEQAAQLIPDFTVEDFMTEKPYAFLYAQKDPFLLQIMVQKMRQKAQELGFKAFLQTWNAYVKAHKPGNTSVVGENDTMFPGQPVQLRCGSYVCDESGVRRYSELTGDVEVISHPIMPIKRVTNIETFEEKLEVAYCRGKDPWKEITVSREQLASAQKIVSLAKQGVAVNSENAKEVIKFISTLESKNYDDLPRQNSVGHMGWLSDGRFLPYVDDISYDGDSPEFVRMYNELKPTGDEETWMKVARDVRSGQSVPARIAMAAGFAAPLVKLFGALPFFVHLWGDKGCGKSVGLMVAASIWGNPEIGAYVKTFSATKVFLELYAAFCCNLPVLLDELQVINDNKKSFDDIIYMLCEGSTKGRGAKDGGLQLQRKWSTCVVTTGETPIIQSNSGGGAAVRTIEVNFKGQPLFGSDEHAREVANLVKENYGFAGKRFITALQRPEIVESLRNIQKKYYTALAGDIDGKQILSASILLAADKMADLAIFKDGKSLTVDEVKEFLITKDEADVNKRCYGYIMDMVDANPRRFDAADNNSGELWGVIEKETVYINRSIFENKMRDGGYSVKPFLNWAKMRGLLEVEYNADGSQNRMTVRKSLPGGRARCVALRMDYEKKLAEGFAQVMAPDDMPF